MKAALTELLLFIPALTALVGSRIQASSFQPVPVFITSGLIYLVLTTTITQFAAALERKASAGAA